MYVLENYIKVERPCAPFTWFPHGYLSWTFTVNIRIRGCHWCSVCSTRSIGFPSSVILLLLLLLMQPLISSGILYRADASRLRLCLHLTCRHLVSLFPFPCRPTSYLNIFNNWFWFIVNALFVSTFRVFFLFLVCSSYYIVHLSSLTVGVLLTLVKCKILSLSNCEHPPQTCECLEYFSFQVWRCLISFLISPVWVPLQAVMNWLWP